MTKDSTLLKIKILIYRLLGYYYVNSTKTKFTSFSQSQRMVNNPNMIVCNAVPPKIIPPHIPYFFEHKIINLFQKKNLHKFRKSILQCL